jgi:hypothetical protein
VGLKSPIARHTNAYADVQKGQNSKQITISMNIEADIYMLDALFVQIPL